MSMLPNKRGTTLNGQKKQLHLAAAMLQCRRRGNSELKDGTLEFKGSWASRVGNRAMLKEVPQARGRVEPAQILVMVVNLCSGWQTGSYA
jgi:hypothetical protein